MLPVPQPESNPWHSERNQENALYCKKEEKKTSAIRELSRAKLCGVSSLPMFQLRSDISTEQQDVLTPLPCPFEDPLHQRRL